MNELGQTTIMVVEDDEVICTLFQMVFEQQGFTVIAHTDPRRAVEDFREKLEFVDVVITDYGMPEMNGFEVLNAVKKIAPNIPVALATGSRDISFEEAVAKGFQACFKKPFIIGDIVNVVLRLVRSAHSS